MGIAAFSKQVMSEVQVSPVRSSADRRAFVDFAYAHNRSDLHWVPPLRSEVRGLIDPRSNPWFEHAEAQFFVARRGGRLVGRISAQADSLVQQHMGQGIGQWGMLEAVDEETVRTLLHSAELWLRTRGMSRSLGPFSLSIWDEPGLLVAGHNHPPTVMMGHNRPEYEKWVEAAGYQGVKDLYTYEVDVTKSFPPLFARIVASGEKNPRIRIRRIEKQRFNEEAALLLSILNDAWSDNWGFIPLTQNEIAYAGNKLKPIVYEELIRVAEVDGEPVAFVMALPNVNEFLRDLDGRLFPLGWARLLWRLRRPRCQWARVPLLGVVKRLQSTRLASQLAFMLVAQTMREGLPFLGNQRAEIGWILEDNGPMRSIADAIEAKINKVYRMYEKGLCPPGPVEEPLRSRAK